MFSTRKNLTENRSYVGYPHFVKSKERVSFTSSKPTLHFRPMTTQIEAKNVEDTFTGNFVVKQHDLCRFRGSKRYTFLRFDKMCVSDTRTVFC